jgi:ABC-type amino acid transport substrate-binding protein
MTHAFLSTGLAIAVRPEPASFTAALGRALTPSFLELVGGVAVLLVGAGSLMWLVERRDNYEAFGGRDGWLAGLFWAVETVIGYNDPAHQTRLGRLLGIAWAGFGVVVVSALTAQISSQLTLSGLESAGSGPGDLPRVRVGTVQPSAGWRYCERRGLTCTAFPDAEAALNALAAGQVDAVVYEAPILRHFVFEDHPDALQVLPGTFDNHGYGLGLATGSELREPLNRALLEYVATDDWRELVAKYLGPAAD